MDLRKIGILLIFVGIFITVLFVNDDKIFVPALTITVLGFFITVVGFVVEIRKQKIKNCRGFSLAETLMAILIMLLAFLNVEKHLDDIHRDLKSRHHAE